MKYPKRLLGLFIGIDNFKYVSDLGGCVKDIQKVKKYLLANLPDGMTSEVKTLFNEEATKEAIVSTFEDHLLKEAGPDDAVLMYFSGHGAQEEADEVWWNIEADKGLEGLVCHDTGFGPGTATLLGDKELRYLISRLSKKGCDILVITDACHSGDVTRSTTDLTPRTLRLTGALPKRNWDDFIFSGKISKEDVSNHGWNQLVPQGRHIQLAACEDRELAYENANGGVFTHNLIKVLEEKGGEVSYFDLQSKIKFAIKGGPSDVTQTPQVHAAYGHEKEAFKHFLGRESFAAPNYGNLSFNAANGNWILDKGQIHGVNPQSEEDKLLAIAVDSKTVYGSIIQADPGFSVVELQNPESLNKEKTYTSYAKGLFSSLMKIAVEGDTATQNAVREYYQEKKETLRAVNIEWVEDEAMADFVIRGVVHKAADGENDHYVIITFPKEDNPIVSQVKGQTSESALEETFARIESLSKWHFVSQLENPGSSIRQEQVEFQISQHGSGLGINQPVTTITPVFQRDEGAASQNSAPTIHGISASIVNKHPQDLYVSCIYMGAYEMRLGAGGVEMEFSLKPSILQPPVTHLEADHKAHLNGGSDMTFAMNRYVQQFNMPAQLIGFKVIVSTEAFDVQAFDSDGAPVPVSPWPDRSGGRSKGLVFEQPKDVLQGSQWQAWTYWMKVENPTYEEA